jgi:hypothetical protein
MREGADERLHTIALLDDGVSLRGDNWNTRPRQTKFPIDANEAKREPVLWSGSIGQRQAGSEVVWVADHRGKKSKRYRFELVQGITRAFSGLNALAAKPF